MWEGNRITTNFCVGGMVEMSDESISIEELTKERTPSELLRWWDRKNDEVYYSTNEGRKPLTLHKGRAKEFVEEILPLAIFGERNFGSTDQVLLKPVIGNQSYDAVITDLRTEPASQSYVEITQSHEGENEYLRSFVQHNKGLVCRYGTVSKIGTKRTGMQVSIEPDGACVEKAAKDDLEKILAAAERKKGKDYPVNTSLIIFFADSLHFPRVVDDAHLGDFVNRNILKLDLRFSALYLVGLDHVFREYSLAKRSNITKQ
ncbi:hypothetical protein ACFLV6_03575 [Chloroflexota bacterium]